MRLVVTPVSPSLVIVNDSWGLFRRRTYGARLVGATWVDDNGPVTKRVQRAIERQLLGKA